MKRRAQSLFRRDGRDFYASGAAPVIEYPSGATFLYDASSLASFANGAAIDVWPDETDNAYDLTDGTVSPTYKASAFGGVGGAHLSGGAGSYFIQPPASVAAGSMTWAYVAHVDPTLALAVQPVFYDTTNAASDILRQYMWLGTTANTLRFAYRLFAAATLHYIGPGPSTTAACSVVLRGRLSDNRMELWVNGVFCGWKTHASSMFPAINGSNTKIGSHSMGTANNLKGDIGMFGMWPRAMSDSEIDDLHAAIDQRFAGTIKTTHDYDLGSIPIESLGQASTVTDAGMLSRGFTFDFVPNFDSSPTFGQIGLFGSSNGARLYVDVNLGYAYLTSDADASATLSQTSLTFTHGQTYRFCVPRLWNFQCADTGIQTSSWFQAQKTWTGNIIIGSDGVNPAHGQIRNVRVLHAL